jgi:hypothetical protein
MLLVTQHLPLPASYTCTTSLTIYIYMLWPALSDSCNPSLRNILYTAAGCIGQISPSCTSSLTIYMYIYITIRSTSLPPPSMMYHMRAVEATQPPPAPRRSQYSFICCGPPLLRQCAAVRLVRQWCGSARGSSVRLSSSAAMRGSVQQCGSACVVERQCVAVRAVVVCGSALYV